MKFEIADKSTEIQANWDAARLYCFSIGEGWRLPTKEELNQIYQSENDFEKMGYWSYVENNGTNACVQYFTGGDQFTNVKFYGNFYVRAVRDLKDN